MRAKGSFFAVLAVLPALLAVPSFSAAQTVPHYFPDGIERLSEPARQWEAYLRYMNATDICRGTLGADATFPRDFSRAITVERVYEGKKVTFYFEPWVRTGDKIVFYDFCGQRTVTEAEFQVVVDDLVSQFEKAVQMGAEYYRELEKLAVRARAKRIGMSEGDLRARLDQPVPDAPNVTYRELQQLPRPMTKADFVPREVHFGYTPYFGVAWLNTGVLWVTPQSRIVDYLYGHPSVLLHEMTHANANLQSYPLSNGIDVELIASIPEMLLDEDHISLMYHGYLADVRDMVNVYFGFDFAQVRREVVVFDHVRNLRIDTAKFNEHVGKLIEVRRELRKAFLKTLEEFYSDQVFWTSFNEKMQDTRAVFRVMMAFAYDPTIAGGHAETMKFLQRNHRKIMQMANEAYRKSGGESGSGESRRGPSQASLDLLEQMSGMSRDDMLRLARKYRITEDDVRDKSFPELVDLYMRIMEMEAGRTGAPGRVQ
ncbi:MAG TPA: hypothetical protein VD862_00180 [Candidatus Paceibacterota bacterium]|nr:hypothetical protein [Candidatus Paceibacterota bacterium]